ncbi:hypothetical protein VaNZ11_013107, partial [Volvox africanus]
GAPLPPVPRVRLGTRRYIVVVEAPHVPLVHHTSAAAGGSGGGRSGHQLLLSPEQLVVEALARRPHTIRRCDLAATAADAALSAALVEAHMRRLEAQEQHQQQQQQQQQHQRRRQQQQQPQRHDAPGPRAHSTGSSAFLCEPIAAAADEVTKAKENARRVLSDLTRSTPPASASAAAAAVAAAAAINGLVSPSRTSTTLPRASGGGVRPWASGHSGRGGYTLAAAGGASSDGGGGIMEVAGDVVAAEAEAAAVAEAEAAGLAQALPVPEPQRPVATVRGPEVSAGTSSVADAAVEAAEAAGGAAAAGASSSAAATATSTAAAATTSFLNYFIFRTTSARGMSLGGAPATTNATAAAAPAAPVVTAPAVASKSVTSTDLASGTAPAAETPSSRTDGSSLPPSQKNTPSDDRSVQPQPQPPMMPSASATPAAAAAAAAAVAGGLGGTAAAAASQPARDSDSGSAAGLHHNVQPAVLLSALLQDVQEKCGLLHLGLRPVYGCSESSGRSGSGSGSGSGDGGCGNGISGAHQGLGEEGEGCGLVARWREEVMAVVEPGPEADRILDELGNCGGSGDGSGGGGGGGGSRSLASLFAAANGAALESSRCSSYRLLARQEVWHNGTALATLLLQVTRPAALLRPCDFAVMAPQLSGLVVTAAAPLPTAVTTALLRAGAAAVICPYVSTAAPQVSRGQGGAGGTAAATAAAQKSCVVLPYSADGGAQQRGDKVEQAGQPQPQRSLLAASGGRSEGTSALGMGDAMVGCFEGLVSELEEGATVLAAIAAADRQHPALRGRIAFHHL